MPGFSEENLEVRVAPRSVCITAETRGIGTKGRERPVYSERRSNQNFRVLDLPPPNRPGQGERDTRRRHT